MSTLVFSYSHTDETLRDELEKHLSPLKRLGKIAAWHDRRIIAGQDWKNEIDSNFVTADIVLLLISADFISSDYCYEIEMKTAIQRHENGEATIIPVILRPCNWQALPFGKLQAATKEGRAITDFPDLDSGFLEVCKSIEAVLENNQSNASINIIETQNGASLATHSIEPFSSNDLSKQRSSNLAIKKTFTDLDKSKFLARGFEYLSRYFENSLQELKARNTEIDYQFQNLSPKEFEAQIFVNGVSKSRCGLWVSHNSGSFIGDISYSSQGVTRNSTNGSVSVESDGTTLGFKLVFGMSGSRDDPLKTNEGMSEYFWEMFISPLKAW